MQVIEEVQANLRAVADVLRAAKNARLRHIVELKPGTNEYQDKTLCGYEWDMLKPKPNGTICDECEAECKRRLNEIYKGSGAAQ